MANRKILFSKRELIEINTQAAMEFLIHCLGVIRRIHPEHDNMVLIGGKSWWVITETASDAIDFSKVTLESPCKLIENIKKVRSNLLIVRQMEQNRITLYFMSDLDRLEKKLQLNPSLEWSEIEKLKMFSDAGGQSESGECIGFEMIKFSDHDRDRVLMSPTEI